ncbi:MAG: hypothetical protein ACI9S8_003266, partial [Chlamydiales bacterium]
MIRILMTILWGVETLSNITLLIYENIINWLIVLPGVLFTSFMLYLGLPALLLAFTHYSIHPITNIETFWDSIIVAFSFSPWILGAYLGEHFDEIIEPPEEKEPWNKSLPSMTWIGGIFVLIYLFRALTLLFDASYLSDWSQVISDYTGKVI